MSDTYTLPNTPSGYAYRTGLADGLRRCGITFREYEEFSGKTTVLKLEITGKRPGAGRIAKDMKERKS